MPDYQRVLLYLTVSGCLLTEFFWLKILAKRNSVFHTYIFAPCVKLKS